MRVLLVGHACGPDRGSEPGGTWNLAWQLSRFHDVWVMTDPQFRGDVGPDVPLRIDDGGCGFVTARLDPEDHEARSGHLPVSDTKWEVPGITGAPWPCGHVLVPDRTKLARSRHTFVTVHVVCDTGSFHMIKASSRLSVE
jgi:hypothetical protein